MIMIHCTSMVKYSLPSDNMRKTYTVRRIAKHFEGLDSVRLERTVENEETSKLEPRLHLVTGKLVDLWNGSR